MKLSLRIPWSKNKPDFASRIISCCDEMKILTCEYFCCNTLLSELFCADKAWKDVPNKIMEKIIGKKCLRLKIEFFILYILS